MCIKTVVIPVAGMGTRFLPATKVISKEMLPILDKPLLHYAIEEAKSIGIKNFGLIFHKTYLQKLMKAYVLSVLQTLGFV